VECYNSHRRTADLIFDSEQRFESALPAHADTMDFSRRPDEGVAIAQSRLLAQPAAGLSV
jgi:hypothetical protein